MTGWTVEGVVQCPGDCGLYFDFNGTPQDLHTFISEHDCASSKQSRSIDAGTQHRHSGVGEDRNISEHDCAFAQTGEDFR